MLTPEEALLFQAVKDEEQRQAALNMGSVAGAIGGAALGGAGGQIPHMLGQGLNKLRGRTPAAFKPQVCVWPGD